MEFRQSRTQSPQALWPAVKLNCQERLWGHRILLPEYFCGKTMETVTEETIKKFEFFFYVPRVSSGAHPPTKKPEDSGYMIGVKADGNCAYK